MDIFLDRAAIEVFVNNGESTGSYRFVPTEDGKYFTVEVTDYDLAPKPLIVIYELKSIW